MNTSALPHLDKLIKTGQQHLLRGGLKGIEKESLRISANGFISQSPHPQVLGSALTHPHITTDYSEALLEFITPPFADINDTLAFMGDIHQFVTNHLGDELLLAASMPCGIDGDMSIPIANYGQSNIGKMKHIYRKGLWHRYGRTMQAIAGIHFNYSLPEPLLKVLQQQSISSSEIYFNLIRNFQRQGWIILYLFGASPAICQRFFKSRPELMAQFDTFDEYTLYHPYATSLRMSDIGYKSNNQANLAIDYNNVDAYVESLGLAIDTPYADYEKIGIKADGNYQQLNTNILQIENEFYSTVRPKQIAESCEKPTLALKRRGVRYVEIRSLDLDLFEPMGINADNARFIEALLLSCVLQDSPKTKLEDQKIYNQNQLTVAHQGRKPDINLQQGHKTIRLTDWAHQILETIQPICEILDGDDSNKPYSNALKQQQAKVANPEFTPSAKILAGMHQNQQPFAPFALAISAQHQQQFKQKTLDKVKLNQFKHWAMTSHAKQKQIETNDNKSFPQFLNTYFSQK